MCIILFGMAKGFILLPIVLSLIGPLEVEDDAKDSNNEDGGNQVELKETSTNSNGFNFPGNFMTS